VPLDVQVLHRVRDRLGQRTLLMNQIRSILLERGIVVAQGRRKLLDALDALSSDNGDGAVGARVRLLLNDMLDQWRALDTRRLGPWMTSSPTWRATTRQLAAWRQSPASAC